MSISYVVEYCNTVIIDENQLSSALNNSYTTKFERSYKQPPQQQTKIAIVKSLLLSQYRALYL